MCIIVAFSIFLISCLPAENSSVPMDCQIYSLQSDSNFEHKITNYKEILQKYSVPLPKNDISLCNPGRKNLGWQVSTIDMNHHFVFKVSDLEALQREYQNTEITIKEIQHFPSNIKEQSPLVYTAESWQPRKLIFWLIEEGCRQQDITFNEYYAFKASEVLLTELIGENSIEVAEIKKMIHDQKTWALLCNDLKNQISQLDNTDDEYQFKRNTLYNAWIRDYNDNYGKRFLSNNWKDFTNNQLNDSDLLNLDTSAALWSNLDITWAESKGDLAIFTNMLLTQEGF